MWTFGPHEMIEQQVSLDVVVVGGAAQEQQQSRPSLLQAAAVCRQLFDCTPAPQTRTSAFCLSASPSKNSLCRVLLPPRSMPVQSSRLMNRRGTAEAFGETRHFLQRRRQVRERHARQAGDSLAKLGRGEVGHGVKSGSRGIRSTSSRGLGEVGHRGLTSQGGDGISCGGFDRGFPVLFIRGKRGGDAA